MLEIMTAVQSHHHPSCVKIFFGNYLNILLISYIYSNCFTSKKQFNIFYFSLQLGLSKKFDIKFDNLIKYEEVCEESRREETLYEPIT